MRQGSAILAISLFAGLFIAIQVGIALFQKKHTEPPQQLTKPINPPEKGSDITQEPTVKNSLNKKTFPTGWVTQCTGKIPEADCQVEKTITMGETRQRLISIIVRVPPGSSQPAMMFHLPVGLHLPSGVTFQLDDQKQQQLKIQSCDLEGCYAGTAVSTSMLLAMKKSEHLTVMFQNLARTTIRVPVPLNGFKGAYHEMQSSG
ncbi:MAG: invasion associated locus B family protein [Nitrospinota bacterium]|nr:invasion associated locus B family protein [Nitrospinota bacterium]